MAWRDDPTDPTDLRWWWNRNRDRYRAWLVRRLAGALYLGYRCQGHRCPPRLRRLAAAYHATANHWVAALAVADVHTGATVDRFPVPLHYRWGRERRTAFHLAVGVYHVAAAMATDHPTWQPERVRAALQRAAGDHRAATP